MLLRRLLGSFERFDVAILRPYRIPRYRAVKSGELERAVIKGLAERRPVSALLVLLDAEDEPDVSVLEASLLRSCQRKARDSS